MKILVLAKQVPDTWQERELSLETGWVVRDGAAEPVPDEISLGLVGSEMCIRDRHCVRRQASHWPQVLGR